MLAYPVAITVIVLEPDVCNKDAGEDAEGVKVNVPDETLHPEESVVPFTCTDVTAALQAALSLNVMLKAASTLAEVAAVRVGGLGEGIIKGAAFTEVRPVLLKWITAVSGPRLVAVSP